MLLTHISFLLKCFRGAIFQKVADLITGKYRIQCLAATMVGQVRIIYSLALALHVAIFGTSNIIMITGNK